MFLGQFSEVNPRASQGIFSNSPNLSWRLPSSCCTEVAIYPEALHRGYWRMGKLCWVFPNHTSDTSVQFPLKRIVPHGVQDHYLYWGGGDMPYGAICQNNHNKSHTCDNVCHSDTCNFSLNLPYWHLMVHIVSNSIISLLPLYKLLSHRNLKPVNVSVVFILQGSWSSVTISAKLPLATELKKGSRINTIVVNHS